MKALIIWLVIGIIWFVYYWAFLVPRFVRIYGFSWVAAIWSLWAHWLMWPIGLCAWMKARQYLDP